MEQSLEVRNIKIEPTDSTSSNQLEIPTDTQVESVKQGNDGLVQSELDLKTEPQENEIVYPVIACTFHELCPYDEIKVELDEPMIKVENEGLIDELVQDPLDVGNEIKGTNYEICSTNSLKIEKDEPMIKLEGKNSENDYLQEPLDVCNEIKVKALTFKSDEETSNKPGQTGEEVELEYCLTPHNKKTHVSETTSNNQGQFFVPNIEVCKDQKYICSICNKIFKYKSKLDRHLRIHTGEKPFTCHICNTAFNDKCNLNKHMLAHSGEKPHVCDVCKKVFNRKWTLVTHRLIHSGIKSYSCNTCSKSFARKQDFFKHVHIHTVNKPYVCEMCDKAFKRELTLTRHRRIHRTEIQYFCDICNESFAQKIDLSLHKQIHKQ